MTQVLKVVHQQFFKKLVFVKKLVLSNPNAVQTALFFLSVHEDKDIPI